jgi:hypothetical protein
MVAGVADSQWREETDTIKPPTSATKYDLRRASKAQIDDWMKRKREADGTQYVRPAGRIGSTL